MLVQSFPRTKASLVLMVCEIGAPKAQGSRTLGSRRALVRLDVPTSLGTCLVMLWYTVSHTLSTSLAIARADASTLYEEQPWGMPG